MKIKLELHECSFVSTRFNVLTWTENQQYCNKMIESQAKTKENKETKETKEKPFICIYGVPIQISSRIPPNSWIFICEMINDLNQLAGIGLIMNRVHFDKHYIIYKDGNYNRYVYKGKHHITREMIQIHAPELLENIEFLLFRGKGHSKRGQGFTSIPEKHFINNARYRNIKADILWLFTSGIIK